MSILLKVSLTLLIITFIPFMIVVCESDFDSNDRHFYFPWEYRRGNADFRWWFSAIGIYGFCSGVTMFVLWFILKVIWGF